MHRVEFEKMRDQLFLARFIEENPEDDGTLALAALNEHRTGADLTLERVQALTRELRDRDRVRLRLASPASLGRCKFCSSTACHTRIHTRLSRRGGPFYDEVACDKHIAELERDADQLANGHDKAHISSSGRVSRSPVLGEEERELIATGEAVEGLAAAMTGSPVPLALRYQPSDGTWRVSCEAIGLDVALVDLSHTLVRAAEAVGELNDVHS